MGPSIKYVRKIFRKTIISNPLLRKSTCAYWVAKNISFSENLAYELNRWPYTLYDEIKSIFHHFWSALTCDKLSHPWQWIFNYAWDISSLFRIQEFPINFFSHHILPFQSMKRFEFNHELITDTLYFNTTPNKVKLKFTLRFSTNLWEATVCYYHVT